MSVSRTIYVLNSSAANDEALMQLCSSFGDVISFERSAPSSTLQDAAGAISITFEDAADAASAVGNMNGMSFHGAFLRVVNDRNGATPTTATRSKRRRTTDDSAEGGVVGT